jgi:hypothetical protein
MPSSVIWYWNFVLSVWCQSGCALMFSSLLPGGGGTWHRAGGNVCSEQFACFCILMIFKQNAARALVCLHTQTTRAAENSTQRGWNHIGCKKGSKCRSWKIIPGLEFQFNYQILETWWLYQKISVSIKIMLVWNKGSCLFIEHKM